MEKEQNMKIAILSDSHDNIWKLAEAMPTLTSAVNLPIEVSVYLLPAKKMCKGS